MSQRHFPTSIGASGSLGVGDGSRREARDAASRPLLSVLWGAAGRTFTLSDAFLIAFMVVLRVLLSLAGAGEARCARHLEIAIAVTVGLCLVARVLPGIAPRVRSVVYRAGLCGILLANYLFLREILPLVRPDSLDGALLEADRLIFGTTPALWMERFNVRPIVEYFSFFYYSYFIICTTYAVSVLGLTRTGVHTNEWAIGTLIVYGLGQLFYTVVPGGGPWVHMANDFAAPLDGGFFYGLVWEAVRAGGAMKDIFPSLHTAGPLYFALYALHRASEDGRWKWPARISLFFSLNIIVSTMFLRWHWGVDVMAGIVLAFFARFAAPRLAAWEARYRAGQSWMPAWTVREGEAPVPAGDPRPVSES